MSTPEGAPPNPPPVTPAAEPAKVVAYENFQRVVEAKTNLEGEVKTLKGQIQSLTEKAATVDTLSSEVNRWKTEAEKAKGAFGVFTEFSGALGLASPKVINIFDAEYGTLPETERPTRKAWIESLKATPDAAPEHLRPWLAAPQEAPPQGAPRPAQPKPPGTPPTPPGAPAQYGEAEIRKAREELARGNPEPWKAIRKAMGFGGK